MLPAIVLTFFCTLVLFAIVILIVQTLKDRRASFRAEILHEARRQAEDRHYTKWRSEGMEERISQAFERIVALEDKKGKKK